MGSVEGWRHNRAVIVVIAAKTLMKAKKTTASPIACGK